MYFSAYVSSLIVVSHVIFIINLAVTGTQVDFLKCDDSNKLVNNGAITITSTVGKLFNSILNFRLYKFTKKHNLIHLSQIGFTEDARTSYHLFVLKCLVDKYCNTKRELYVS